MQKQFVKMQMFIEQYANSKNNVILMEQNYRCTANILNAANNVIVQNKERLYENKKLWTTAKEGEYLDRVINNNKYTEADLIDFSYRCIENKENDFVKLGEDIQFGIIELTKLLK